MASRPTNAFAAKKQGVKRPVSEIKTAPAPPAAAQKTNAGVKNFKSKAPVAAASAPAAGGKVKSKDSFSNKEIEFLDLEKDDLFKQIKFVKGGEESKMIYFALPNAKGGWDKQFKIIAPARSTNGGLKVLPPKGTIITHNTIFSYPATPEEWKFWSEKMLPDLCDKIWKNAVFFYGKVKGTKIKNLKRAAAHEEIKETMVGDSGDMFFTGPKPNKNAGEPDYVPSIKIKVKEDKKSKLPILDIFDSVTAKKGKPENKFAIYSHGELLPFQANHKDDGPANIAKHNAAIAKVKKVWLTRDKVAKEVPYGTVNDVIWNWFGFTRVNGKLWFSNALCSLNRLALSTYTGGGVRQPGEMAENPFMRRANAAKTAVVVAAGPPLPETEEVKERPAATAMETEATEETTPGDEEEEENKEEEQGEEEEEAEAGGEDEEEQNEEEAGGEEEQEAGGEEEEQEAGGEEQEEQNEEEEQEEEQAVV